MCVRNCQRTSCFTLRWTSVWWTAERSVATLWLARTPSPASASSSIGDQTSRPITGPLLVRHKPRGHSVPCRGFHSPLTFWHTLSHYNHKPLVRWGTQLLAVMIHRIYFWANYNVPMYLLYQYWLSMDKKKNIFFPSTMWHPNRQKNLGQSGLPE